MMQPAPAAEREGMPLEEFLERGSRERFEILNGEVRVKLAHLDEHDDLSRLIFRWLDAYGLSVGGDAYIEGTFVISPQDNPDWVRGSRIPDVMYYAPGRIKAYRSAHTDWRQRPRALVPDLVIEIVSPNDKAGELQEKIDAYFADGVQLIWIIYPAQRQVMVYSADLDHPIILKGNAVLDGGGVLPGFQLPLTQLFALP